MEPSALRVGDVARPADDPLAGIGGQRPIFERVGDVYRTARAKQNFFGVQEFPVVKPTNAYLANGRRRMDWLENWAKRHKLHEETLPRDAFAWLRLGIRQYDLGETESSEASLALALKTDPRTAPLLAAHGRDLVAQGRLGVGVIKDLPTGTNAVPAGR